MKNILILFALFTSVLVNNSYAQDLTSLKVLSTYYDLKDALVSGNANVASNKATELVKAIDSAQDQTIVKEKQELLKHSKLIAGTKDIKAQREQFSQLSTILISVAKSVKLSTEPIYLQYCPMKRSSWLSNEKSIINPYYGTAMLTCGSVSETINP